MDIEIIRKLQEQNQSKIVLLVMDGLGGLPIEAGGKTELEAAHTPNLDKLAAEGICGLHESIGPGITPGSGPAHLSLFGYDPIKYQVGRGVLSALGIEFDLKTGDVAARGNFCTLDETGRVADRRAGRIPTEKNVELLEKLKDIEFPGVEVFLRPVKEYRMLLVLRGEGLSGEIADTDPQDVGEKPLEPRPLTPEAERTAGLVSQFLSQVRDILADEQPANFVLLRGFAQRPDWPMVKDVYGLRALAIAAYPMYRGVSKLVGMDTVQSGDSLEEEFDLLKKHWNDYDFFFLHVKKVDSYGEDGDFDKKVHLIEEVDQFIPQLRDLGPDVIVVTGDHSTPSKMKSHGFQPVPVLIWSEFCRPDEVKTFGERACMQGGLGPRIPGKDLMAIALGNAGRLEKFGA